MKAKISVFVMCVEAIIYLLLYNLHDCTFKLLIYFSDISKLPLRMVFFRLLKISSNFWWVTNNTETSNIALKIDISVSNS